MIVFAAILILVIILNYSGALAPLNRHFIDRTCTVDSDCTVIRTRCHPNPCNCGVAVNKDWNGFCPFININVGVCIQCPLYEEGDEGPKVKCVNNRCKEVFT